MSRLNRPSTSRPADAKTAAWRVRFLADAPGGSKVIHRFSDPVPAVAVLEPIQNESLPQEPSWPEPVDDLRIVHISDSRTHSKIWSDWLATPDQADAPLTVSFTVNETLIRWRPGRAVIEGEPGSADEIIAALAEFAFYESQLRKFEGAVAAVESAASDDAQHAYVIGSQDANHWSRFRATMEKLASLRLSAARLEPRLYLRCRALPMTSRQVISRLRTRADVEARLESLSDRLEACEDLYEGAVDRVTDHRWYRKGMWIEIAIVVLLFLEVVQIAISMIFHNH